MTDGMPIFQVKVELLKPSDEIQKYIIQKDKFEFDSFNNSYESFKQENQLNNSGDEKPAVFEARSYLIISAQIVSGPQYYDNYNFRYPIPLKGVDVENPKIITSYLGYLNEDQNPAIAIIDAVDATENFLLEHSIFSRCGANFELYKDGNIISSEKIPLMVVKD